MKSIASIVIPTYRRPDRIRRAVLSALNQSYQFLEVIVVDDNGENTEFSRDTRLAIHDLIDNQSIQYYCNVSNKGGSYSRNVGLDKSTGEFITFLDDDDEIEISKIEKQINKLNSMGSSYGAVYTGYKKIISRGIIINSSETINGDVYEYALSRSLYIGSGSNLLVRTHIAKELNGYDIDFKRNQDLEFMTRILKNYKLAYVNESLLTIHYEIREVKRSYEDMVNIDNFYLSKFQHEIEALDKNQQRNLKSIVALERFRYSLFDNVFDGIKNLLVTKVSIILFLKYLIYIFDRLINKKSYGFKANWGKV